MLSHFSGDQIKWERTTENGQTNITIYNNTKDNPRSESQNLHIIAKIVNFTGTFDHNDFLLHDLDNDIYDYPTPLDSLLLENILLTEIP